MAGETGPEGPVDDGNVSATPPGVDADPLPARSQTRKRGRWTVQLADEAAPRFALDLSLGGLFLSGVELAPGTRVSMTLVLGAETLALTATVRWSRQGRLVSRALRGVGVSFDGLDDGARSALAAELEATP